MASFGKKRCLLLAVFRAAYLSRVIARVDAGKVSGAPGRVLEAQPAVHRDVDAGEERRFLGSEKHRAPGEVRRPWKPLQGNHLQVVVAGIERAGVRADVS